MFMDVFMGSDPKATTPKLVEILCGHFDVYDDEPWHGQAVGAAVDWFSRHLGA